MSSLKLLQNGTVISFDSATEDVVILRETSVLIRDGIIDKILSKRESAELVLDNTEVIDVTGQIVCPGFVDTHRHSWLTAYRTLCPDTTLATYLFWISHLSPVTRAGFSAEDIYDSTLAGFFEAVNGGVTTVLEHAHSNWSHEVMRRELDACVDSGVRTFWCFAPQHQDDFSIDQQQQTFKAMAKKGREAPSLVSMGFAWDSYGMDSQSEIDANKGLIKELELEVITTHCMVGPWGTDHSNSVENAEKHGLLDMGLPMIFAHGGFVTDKEKNMLRDKNHFLSITPESEMHCGHGQSSCFDIPDQSALGVDLACTFSGDLITQARMWLQTNRTMRYNETLSKGLIPRQNPMGVKEAFLLATRQGGLALHRPDIGVLTVGAKADIVVFDGDSPHMCGWQDPVAAVILHANTGDIKHVLVDGQFRKRDGELVMCEPWGQIRGRLQKLAARVQSENKEPPTLGETLWGKPFGEVEAVSTRKK